MRRRAAMAGAVIAGAMAAAAFSAAEPLPFKPDVARTHPSAIVPVQIVIWGAAIPDPPRVTDQVRGHPGVTYLDLLRQAIPDLAYNAADKQVEGHLKSLRHIEGSSFANKPPDPVVVSFVQNVRLKAAGIDRIALLVDLGQSRQGPASTTLLALYDNARRPKLLDAVDIGVDRHTSPYGDLSPISLGPGDAALAVGSETFSSNQSYYQWLLIFVRGDRLHLIDHVSLHSRSRCGFARDEYPSFDTKPGEPYAALVVTVTETGMRFGEGCADQPMPAPYLRTYRATYQWDAARGDFVAHGDLGELDKLNGERF